MRTIERIEAFPIRLPVTATFRFSSGSAGRTGETAAFVLVKLTDSEGESGWGEGRPMPQWSYETAESMVAAIRNYLAPAVLGISITDRAGLHSKMHGAIGRGPSTGQPVAKAAVDMALHDLCARVAGMPLRAFLGGSCEPRSVALSYTVTAHNSAEAVTEVGEASSRGFRHFNFKVGVERSTDTAVARAVREAAGMDSFVWADANQGLSLPGTLSLARHLADAGTNVLEQPFPADQPHLHKQLRHQCSLPLAVDEASVSPADFYHYASEGLVDYLVVKVTRSGGIWPTLQQMAVAAAAGLPLLVSGLTDGLLTKMAACQTVASVGFTGPAALNGSQFVDESELYPSKSEVESGGIVELGDALGIGVQPDEHALTRLVIPELM